MILVFGLQQVLNGAFRQSGKSCIRWGKHGERAVAFQRVNQISRLNSCHKGAEIAGTNSCVNDVFHMAARRGLTSHNKNSSGGRKKFTHRWGAIAESW